MRTPHGLREPDGEHNRRLGRRGAELLQLNLLLAFPFLAPPLYAGFGARPGADVSEGDKPPRVFARTHRVQFLAPSGHRLSGARPGSPAETAVPARERETRRCILDVGAVADLCGRRGLHRARLPRGPAVLVPARAAGTTGVAGLADRRAHRMQS